MAILKPISQSVRSRYEEDRSGQVYAGKHNDISTHGIHRRRRDLRTGRVSPHTDGLPSSLPCPSPWRHSRAAFPECRAVLAPSGCRSPDCLQPMKHRHVKAGALDKHDRFHQLKAKCIKFHFCHCLLMYCMSFCCLKKGFPLSI